MKEDKDTKAISIIFPYLGRYGWGYFFGTALLLAVNLLGAYIPQLIRKSVDMVQSFFSQGELIYYVTLIIGLALVMGILRAFSRQIIFGIGRSVEYDFKKDIFNHLIKMQPNFFTEKKTGDLISIITNDVQSMRAISGFGMLNVINTVIAFAVIIPLMFDLSHKLTLYFLSIIPAIFIFVTLLSQKLKTYQEKVQEKLGFISNYIEQSLSGISVIKTFAQESSEVKRFSRVNNSLLDDYISLVKSRSLIGPSMRIMTSVGVVLLLYIGGHEIVADNFSLGDFAAFFLYIERLLWPVATLGWLMTVFYRGVVSAKRIGNVLSIEPTIKDHEKAIDLKDFQGEIDLRSLGIEIKKGQSVGIVGTIGSGKSVLAAKMMHLTELNDGEIFIDAHDIKDLKLESLRSLVNLVPQENFLFSTSIKENISYAVDMPDSEVERLARLVSIEDEILSFVNQYDTEVGERGITLSGGQRQRLAIARALSINPEILILDDALSSVDNETATKILANVKKERCGKTNIFITHKVQAIKDMDLILVMDGLKVVQKGKHEDLMGKGIYGELWDTAQAEEVILEEGSNG